MLEYLIWFLLGSIIYSIVDRSINRHETKKTYRTMSAINSVIIHSLHTEIDNAMKVKHRCLLQSDKLTDALVNSIIKKDRSFLYTWKKTVYLTVLSTVPEQQRHTFEFMGLDEALEHLKIKEEAIGKK